MAKMIKVENCNYCYYMDKHPRSLGRNSYSCSHDKTFNKEIDNKFKIPSWCPLHDYPEEGKDE